jgi:hypothetical protein
MNPKKSKIMSKVKLDLQRKDSIQLRIFAKEHAAAMVENANYPIPVPSAEVFGAAFDSYAVKLDRISATETILQTLRAERDVLRVSLEGNLNSRGAYVDDVSRGDIAKILSAAFAVQADATPTTSMEKPYEVSATMGDNPGEIDLSCHAMPNAKSYLIERRDHSDTAMPGAWLQVKVSTRSTATIPGLISGTRHAFRIRALGPKDLESPWSDEAICMAP